MNVNEFDSLICCNAFVFVIISEWFDGDRIDSSSITLRLFSASILALPSEDRSMSVSSSSIAAHERF